MVRKSVQKFALVVLLLFWASSAVAQRDGVATFSIADTHEVDTINLTTLVPSFNFLGLTKIKGALPGSFVLEAPGNCFVANSGTNQFWSCGNNTGYTTPVKFQLAEAAAMSINYTGPTTMGSCISWQIYGMFGSDGITYHPFSSSVAHVLYKTSACGAQTLTLTTVDNSGYTVAFSTTSGFLNTTSIYNTSGWLGGGNGSTSITDPFSNTISTSTVGSTTTFTDSLGAATTITGSQDSGDPTNYAYTDTGGNTQNITLTTGSAQSFIPLGSSSCVNYPSTPFTVHPVTKITYPDSTTFGITWATNGTGISGLIGSVTLRTGGQISYTYTGASTGCGPLTFTGLTRATPDGNTTYAVSVNGTTYTTTVKDPGLNKTVYTFYVPAGGPSFITQVDSYQNTGTVASPSYTHIAETTYCYQTTCTATPSYPITQTQVDEYTYTPTGTQVHMSEDVKTYDSTYGLLLTDAKTDEITSQTITKTIVYGSYSSGSCSAITNTNIVDHPCTATTKNGTTWLSESTYTYNSNGALTSSSACLNSSCSSALTTTYTPTTHGTYSAVQDPNGQTVNYTYGSCNSLMPTDVTTTVNSIAIDNKATWNCNAGVVTDTTDPNSNEDDYTFDSMNRISTYHDRMGDTNTTSYAYGTPTLDHVKVTDNIGVVRYKYVEALGRPSVDQICETTGCSTLDTVSYAYGWKDSGNNALTNFQTTTSGGTSSAACTTTTPGSTCSTVTVTALTNPIAGPYKTTDANGGTVTNAVNSKDFSVTVGPAPSGEHTKVVQTEVDGFGRVTSTCAIENSGGTTCGQTMGNSGILTSNVYSFATGAPKVVATRGSQSHTKIADAVGRTASIATPEAGTTTYTYDSIAANFCVTGGGASSSAGDLVATTDAASNKVCMYYDGLHRLTDVGNSNQSSTNPCKRYRYDSTANNAYTKPTGYPTTGANLIGRLLEASTDDCTFPLAQAHMITDEWFAYDAMGRMTDMWETTPDSSGFYHTTVAYDADGTVTSLTSPFSTATWGFDGEERPNSLTYGSATIVSATAGSGFKYDAAGRPTNVPIGNGTNQDALTYDQLEHMLTYTFPVSTKSDAGTLTWNPIGSLGKLVINDTITSSTDSQTCTYAYDDVARLTSVAGASCNATQTFGYDQYDNMWQSGTYSFGCSTCYSSTSNEQTGTPTMTYDSDGNVTNDGTNTYTWNVYGKMASARSGSFAAVCGTSGECDTYDASGNLVEVNVTGSTSEYLYSPIGRVGSMNGQTGVWLMVPAPGGGTFWANNGTNYFIHADWLGTGRLVNTISGTTIFNDQAVAPYGQQYNVLGSAFGFFTGDIEDTNGLYLTPNRTIATNSGRWLSPDPAHSGWNAYAYVTDPNRQTDRSGLCLACPPSPWGSPFSASFGSFGFLDINPNGGPPQPDSSNSTGMNDAFSMALAFANQNVDDYNNYVAFQPMLGFLKPKDQGYLSDTEIRLLGNLRARFTQELSEMLDSNDDILYRNKEELEEATYRAMELMEAGADDPTGLVEIETNSIRANPQNADAIRASINELAVQEGAEGDFNSIISGEGGGGGGSSSGGINSILLGAHIYEELRDPNNLNHKEAMWLLRALGDTTYAPPLIICNGHGCGSSW